MATNYSSVRRSPSPDEAMPWPLRPEGEDQPLNPRPMTSRNTRKTEASNYRPAFLQHHDQTLYSTGHRPASITWQPSLLRNVPWIGLLSSFAAIACAMASIAILETSDGDLIQNWTLAPSIYLAILSTIANVSLAAAFNVGAVVTWWRHAVSGCTTGSLSEVWGLGRGTLQAIRAIRKAPRLHSHRLAVANLLLVMTLLHGPFFQGAVRVATRSQDAISPMEASIAPEVPGSYTAVRSSRNSVVSPSSAFLTVLQEYYSRTSIKSPFNSTCEGGCSGSVVAAGLSISDCNSTSYPVDYRDLPSSDDGDITQLIYGTGLSVEIQSHPGPENEDRLNLTVGGPVMNDDCTGSFTSTTCFLHSSLVGYDLNISKDHITFASQIHHPPIYARANNTYQGPSSGYLTTLGGLLFAGRSLFSTNFTWYFNPDYNWQYLNPSVFALAYGGKPTQSTADCPSSFTDPTDDILSSLNEILFRLSLHAANDTQFNSTQHPLDSGVQMTQLVETRQIEILVVYEVVHWASALAAVLLLIGAASVISTLWGWWQLGTKLTLDPIEVGKAFGSPLLREQDKKGRSEMAEIWSENALRRARPTRPENGSITESTILRYGEVMLEEEAVLSMQRTRVDRRTLASDLTNGLDGEGSLGADVRRLQIGDMRETWPPQIGRQYLR